MEKKSEMNKVEFREADELVSALQNDVEGIIFELRGEDKRKNDVGVPACFCGTPYDYWKKLQAPIIDKIEVAENGLVFYSRGQRRYIMDIVEDYIKDKEIELRVRETIDEVANEVYRNTVIKNMKNTGMVK